MGLLSRLGKKLRIVGNGPVPGPSSPRPASSRPPSPVVEAEETSPRGDVPPRQFIEQTLKAHPVVLFMKGTPEAPRCGFSANAASILASYGRPFHTVDVTIDDEVREDIKAYSSWPTLPQVFVRGEFVGGADILSQLHANGELGKLLEAPREPEAV